MGSLTASRLQKTDGENAMSDALPLGLRQALESGQCVLFVGAGAGKHLLGPDSNPAPLLAGTHGQPGQAASWERRLRSGGTAGYKDDGQCLVTSDETTT